ncbi:hypothetical protein DOTSEDRAFT_42524 [Dothistroma septosporum NZE10]|uniref:Secondary metabolism regulator LAE1 n=1 Tax=Dothistroma septosporum (strain NZE10 / CBS 128990) TaxID=675120 RepID=N1PXZ4_DOTSN|nr:hypothetical protein DOTSEDRAFT_42524 [Dothistroma septosporum NZE10]
MDHVPTQQQQAEPLLNAVLDVDSSGADSGLGSDVDSIESASLASSIFGYTYENGRRYHAFREGNYLLPNDAEEQDRLDLHHHIFRLAVRGSLHRAPIGPDIKRALDFGTGTGIWAIDLADERPECEVVGTDLSPIQPGWLPPNCKFYVDDVESEWTWMPNEAFDYIHARGMGGSISDWPLLYSRIFSHLKPGGWLEMQEYAAWISSHDDPDLTKAPHTKQWQELIDEASLKFGKRMNVAHEQKGWIEAAGFVDVVDDVVEVPIGPWAKGAKLKEIGRYQREHMNACIEAFTLAPLTRILGWRAEEAQVLMAGVRAEFNNPKIHLLTVFHYVYGRRPM